MKETPMLQYGGRTLEDLGTPLGRGRTAEVFAWGDRQVLKLFHADFAPEAIEREWTVAQVLKALPVEQPHRAHASPTWPNQAISLQHSVGLVATRPH